jgi:hypothetical protein
MIEETGDEENPVYVIFVTDENGSVEVGRYDKNGDPVGERRQ